MTISVFDLVVSTAADGNARSTDEDWCKYMARKEYTMLETGCNLILVDEFAFGWNTGQSLLNH